MPTPTTPATVVTIPPMVGATELAMTSLSPGTTWGRAADSEARKNRFTPRAASALTYSGTPSSPAPISSAVMVTRTARTSAETSRICRRDQRSMKTPANGPMKE